MLRDDDHVGEVFKRAFRRVDGLTMYCFIAIWALLSVWHWLAGDLQGSGFVVLSAMICAMNAVLFVMFGLSGLPGLASALIIAGFNIRFLCTMGAAH